MLLFVGQNSKHGGRTGTALPPEDTNKDNAGALPSNKNARTSRPDSLAVAPPLLVPLLPPCDELSEIDSVRLRPREFPRGRSIMRVVLGLIPTQQKVDSALNIRPLCGLERTPCLLLIETHVLDECDPFSLLWMTLRHALP
jgi:hypothetical protein